MGVRTTANTTAREEAYNIALGYLRNVYDGKTADIENADPRETIQREVKRQVAKLHNRLLKASAMDGIDLDEEFDNPETKLYREFDKLMGSSKEDSNG